VTIKVVGSNYDVVSDQIYKFVKEYRRNVESDGNLIVAITLGGAHSKGLHNKRSDIDLNVYYLRSLENLISVSPKTFTMKANSTLKQIPKEESIVVFDYENKEY